MFRKIILEFSNKKILLKIVSEKVEFHTFLFVNIFVGI